MLCFFRAFSSIFPASKRSTGVEKMLRVWIAQTKNKFFKLVSSQISFHFTISATGQTSGRAGRTFINGFIYKVTITNITRPYKQKYHIIFTAILMCKTSQNQGILKVLACCFPKLFKAHFNAIKKKSAFTAINVILGFILVRTWQANYFNCICLYSAADLSIIRSNTHTQAGTHAHTHHHRPGTKQNRCRTNDPLAE